MFLPRSIIVRLLDFSWSFANVQAELFEKKKGEYAMPYVPSKKTDGVSDDREVLDQAVERVAEEAADSIKNNLSLISVYGKIFSSVICRLNELVHGNTSRVVDTCSALLADAIFEVGRKYDYEGAFLGGLNYSITRLIQRVPQIKVESGVWKEAGEFRYWLYACTVQTLIRVAVEWRDSGLGIGGVFGDIKDEYERRVKAPYEAAQILKNGDCYDTPYYTRLVPVIDEDGNTVGHMEVMMKRSDDTLDKDALDYVLVLKKK